MREPSWMQPLLRKKTVEQLHQESDHWETTGHSLKRTLGVFDLTCFGIAAVVGAGIFTTIGRASAEGGPAVSVLFVLTAVACLFSAYCYSEFASRIPVSGSAYTYSYAVFGELVAWLIGWNLLMEYAIGNSVVAFSWSDYFSNLLDGIGTPLPGWLQNDYYSCSLAKADPQASNAALLTVWENAPRLNGIPIIFDLPALVLNVMITALVYIGINESRLASNAMVILKLAVVLSVIGIGAFYVTPANWTPFAPNGASGVLAGISAVFFTYIGFDAISTTAEECKNPKRDLPIATMLTLVICTVIYVTLSFVLTGMVHYSKLGTDDPLALVFEEHHLDIVSRVVSVSAVIAVASVFLVFQLGQPRIFLSMARDGLLPKRFARIHPRFKTPSFATVVTGIAVALPTLFLNSQLVTDLSALGTLFAFVLVSGGILVLNAQDRANQTPARSGFKVPYINGSYIVPILLVVYAATMQWMPESHDLTKDWSWEKFPYFVFFGAFFAMAVMTWVYRWSLIPVLGVLTNLYLIAGIGHWNWLRFAVWCCIGIAFYFAYGFYNSRLARS